MGNIIYEGRIVSNFTGFHENALFKMDNNTYWLQSRYHYWYCSSYRPNAIIMDINGSILLVVNGNSVPVKRIYDVIESHINGAFKGWKSKISYKLSNGQVWEQTRYTMNINMHIDLKC